MSQRAPPTTRIPTLVRVVNLGLTLVLVTGVTWGALTFAAPTYEAGRLTILMGFVLLAATLHGSGPRPGGCGRNLGL